MIGVQTHFDTTVKYYKDYTTRTLPGYFAKDKNTWETLKVRPSVNFCGYIGTW